MSTSSQYFCLFAVFFFVVDHNQIARNGLWFHEAMRRPLLKFSIYDFWFHVDYMTTCSANSSRRRDNRYRRILAMSAMNLVFCRDFCRWKWHSRSRCGAIFALEIWTQRNGLVLRFICSKCALQRRCSFDTNHIGIKAFRVSRIVRFKKKNSCLFFTVAISRETIIFSTLIVRLYDLIRFLYLSRHLVRWECVENGV